MSAIMLTEQQVRQVRLLLVAGQVIPAIKLLRAELGLSLRDAKDTVDGLRIVSSEMAMALSKTAKQSKQLATQEMLYAIRRDPAHGSRYLTKQGDRFCDVLDSNSVFTGHEAVAVLVNATGLGGDVKNTGLQIIPVIWED